MPPRFGTKTEYKQAIAQAIGLDEAEDLSIEHDDFLEVQSLVRLEIILDLVETAAATVSADVTANYSDEINNGPDMLNAIALLATNAIKNRKSASAVDLAQEILNIIERNDVEEEEEHADLPELE